jgi:hypothetical protein
MSFPNQRRENMRAKNRMALLGFDTANLYPGMKHDV